MWQQAQLFKNTIKLKAGQRFGPFGAEIQQKFPELPKYLAIRHPVERFASMWRSQCRDPNIVGGIRGMNPEVLMEHVRKYPKANNHWALQASYVIPGNILIDYAELLARLSLPPYRHRANKTEIQETDPPMPEAAIREFFAEDFVLWESIQHEKINEN